MPNHVHCIITLTDYNVATDNDDNVGGGVDGGVKKIHEFSLRGYGRGQLDVKQYRKMRRNMVLVKMLGKFQQQTSKHINILRNSLGTKNWQHDYYDHVIRNNKSYNTIKYYIINNPKKWGDDKFNTNHS